MTPFLELLSLKKLVDDQTMMRTQIKRSIGAGLLFFCGSLQIYFCKIQPRGIAKKLSIIIF